MCLRHTILRNGYRVSQLNLPDDDHIVRYVPWTKVDKDANDNVRGILWTAYQRRDDEDGLSVNWLERTGCEDLEAQLRATVSLLETAMTVKRKARLAVSGVRQFKSVCAAHEARVRIVHIPEGDNEPHSEIRQIPKEDQRLMEDLARQAVTSHHACGDLMD